MLPNSIGVLVGFTALALTWTLVPGVLNTAPRGELELKKLGGRLFGAAEPSGTPSQLISRRPLPTDPATFGLSVPRSVRNASTWPWIAAALAPDAAKVIGAATDVAGPIRMGTESAIAAVVVVRHLESIMLLSSHRLRAMQELCRNGSALICE